MEGKKKSRKPRTSKDEKEALFRAAIFAKENGALRGELESVRRALETQVAQTDADEKSIKILQANLQDARYENANLRTSINSAYADRNTAQHEAEHLRKQGVIDAPKLVQIVDELVAFVHGVAVTTLPEDVAARVMLTVDTQRVRVKVLCPATK